MYIVRNLQQNNSKKTQQLSSKVDFISLNCRENKCKNVFVICVK